MQRLASSSRWRLLGFAACCFFLGAAACGRDKDFDAQEPEAGPGELVGQRDALNARFEGGASMDIPARVIEGDPNWQKCDGECQAFCAAQTFNNPIDRAMCPHLWGAGYDTRPVVDTEACRRVHADLKGRFPSYGEIADGCLGRPIGDAVLEWIKDDQFVLQNQRRWADVFRYNNVAVNLERIYDADKLVGKLYGGFVRYDEFVEVMSAHPVFLRRFDDAGDRAEALFNVFVGRPPFANERADMAKLYALWGNGYHDHPELGLRLPDSYIDHKCITEDGKRDEDTAGACTSVLWGFNRVVLLPDFRAVDNQTWVGNLTEKEWKLLQTPGRIVGSWPQVWEHAVSEVLELYLGYDLSKYTPSVVQELVEYVLKHKGDIRAAHYAVLTSALYLQSTTCDDSTCDPELETPPWTYGPLRQAEAEQWIDSIDASVNRKLGACDHRIPSANELLESSVVGHELVANSRWKVTDEDRVDDRYSSLAQTLGGCPDNLVAGRFKAISILNTATQEAFVAGLCNPGGEKGEGVNAKVLLPNGVSPATVLDADLAVRIAEHQIGEFFSRTPVDAEVTMAQTGAGSCVPKPCTAESFSRVLCYALLSSSEMLFY